MAAQTNVSFCSQGTHATWVVCDPTRTLEDRAADIVGRLSIADKLAALGSSTPALSSVGLPAYTWWSEATHGINHVKNNADHPYQSNTALPITTSCSFNRTLWAATGNVIGREARAFMNAGLAYGTFWTPVINLVRDPRWGRIIECVGEDPFTSGAYAISFIGGFEHAKDVSYPLQASACVKHFVANELEATNGTDRYHFNAIIPIQDLVDYYLPPFQDGVETGQVRGKN